MKTLKPSSGSETVLTAAAVPGSPPLKSGELPYSTYPASANPVSHQVMDIPFRVPVGEIVM